jgi:DNA-binding NarL/FixJ family response regulator
MKIKRVMLVDDHPIVRQGLKLLIDQEADLKVCCEASNAVQAMENLRLHKVDIVILDLSLDGVSGLEVLKQIRTEYPEMLVLIFSIHEEYLYAERVLKAGAKGYIVKQEASEKIVPAIYRVLNGEIVVCDRMLEKILRKMGDKPAGLEFDVENLTDRELEVFRLIGMGDSTRRIAETLGISVKTVETHRENIKRKMTLKNGAELHQRAVQFMQIKTGEPAPPQPLTGG